MGAEHILNTAAGMSTGLTANTAPQLSSAQSLTQNPNIHNKWQAMKIKVRCAPHCPWDVVNGLAGHRTGTAVSHMQEDTNIRV